MNNDGMQRREMDSSREAEQVLKLVKFQMPVLNELLIYKEIYLY